MLKFNIKYVLYTTISHGTVAKCLYYNVTILCSNTILGFHVTSYISVRVNLKSRYGHRSELNVHCMCDHVFGSNQVKFRIICPNLYSINLNTIDVDPHSDSLLNGKVKTKNIKYVLYTTTSHGTVAMRLY